MSFIFLGLFAKAEAGCVHGFLGVPPWYEFLTVRVANQCAPEIKNLNDIWLIGLALIEILTRIAILAALAFIIYGGIKYGASRGNADKVTSAKSTLIDALTGLIISIVATAAVSFAAGRFSG